MLRRANIGEAALVPPILKLGGGGGTYKQFLRSYAYVYVSHCKEYGSRHNFISL